MSRTPFYINEDLDIFFKGAFSEDCILVSNRNNIIDCLYTERFGFINGFDQDVNGVSITVTLKNSDIETNQIKKGYLLKIRNIDFMVREVRRDGNGISVCELEKIKD